MTQTATYSLDFAAATDIGCHRGNNEDSFGYDAEQHLYVVCDGMGGSAAGEVASGMAVRALIESFESMALQVANNDNILPKEQRLLYAIYEANRAVRSASEANPELHNMGTTLVCACLDEGRILIGNVGDSRAYLVRNGICSSNLQSVITRAIGTADEVEADLFAAELNLNDMFLLTSDGLTRYAKPEDIAKAAAPDAELSAICQSLIDHAKRGGGADNITCMMLRVVETPPSTQELADQAPTEN